MSPKQSDRKEFESYLQGESSLARAYKATAKETPPPKLNARILERARTAVRREARVTRSPFANNWMIPASLVAVLILTVGLVTFMFEKTDTPLLPETAPVPSRDSALEEEASFIRDEAREADDTLRSDRSVDEKATTKAKRRLMVEPPSASAPAVEGSTKARQQSQEKAEMKQTAPAEPEAASDQTTDERMRSSASGGAATRIESQEMRPNMSLESAGELDKLDKASEVTETMTPEEWLAKIATLRAQGKFAEADANLAAFRKRYPDYSVERLRE